ncbi:hypothetical protein HMPREF9103_00242 [Lentilactobacillus parafarraginis F0439]|uniref:Uncharacterized protein n=1 Tax=Lentilactobacillus parafarraginis F0439 TaxID=797515 RepID=G9ZKJ4_9LACO|nr:hypothetical protein HMPREF9103_00242 [Lentilactobacillus parafarraginis F0439]
MTIDYRDQLNPNLNSDGFDIIRVFLNRNANILKSSFKLVVHNEI